MECLRICNITVLVTIDKGDKAEINGSILGDKEELLTLQV